MPDVPETIAIRNPRVLEVVGEEMGFGAGRNATEAAENLILAGAEDRRLERALRDSSSSKPRERRAQPA